MQPADLEQLLLGALGSEWQIKYESPPRPQHDYGVCILWNQSILQVIFFQHLTLPLIPLAKVWEKVWIRLHGFKDFIVRRGALIGTFNWNGCRVRITSLHLDWQGGRNHRKTQLAYIREYLILHPEADAEIITGDFNTINVFNKVEQGQRIAAIFGNEFHDACNKPAVTCPPFILDHMLVKNLQVLEFQVHTLAGSDHFPIFAKVAL